MKVSYKGVHNDLPEKLQEKLDAKFAKLSKMLEQNGEREAHVILTHERRLHNAEITLQFYDHKLVAIGSDSDIFNAMSAALLKLEKQAVKHTAKFRDKKRRDPKGCAQRRIGHKQHQIHAHHARWNGDNAVNKRQQAGDEDDDCAILAKQAQPAIIFSH